MVKYSYTELDFTKQEHQMALFQLMNAYMLDRMGCEKALSEKLFPDLLNGLQKQTNYLGILVKCNEKYIGLANCFVNFSTFQMASLINIHDFIVLPEYRGKGVGRFLMQVIKSIGKAMGCCKINLEVREDNNIAQSLYQSEGFKECKPVMHFWEFPLLQDSD